MVVLSVVRVRDWAVLAERAVGSLRVVRWLDPPVVRAVRAGDSPASPARPAAGYPPDFPAAETFVEAGYPPDLPDPGA